MWTKTHSCSRDLQPCPPPKWVAVEAPHSSQTSAQGPSSGARWGSPSAASSQSASTGGPGCSTCASTGHLSAFNPSRYVYGPTLSDLAPSNCWTNRLAIEASKVWLSCSRATFSTAQCSSKCFWACLGRLSGAVGHYSRRICCSSFPFVNHRAWPIHQPNTRILIPFAFCILFLNQKCN